MIVADVSVAEEDVKVFVGGVASKTEREKEVFLVVPPPVAVTVMVLIPVGVEPVAVMVRVVEQLGEQETGEKEALAPVGRPEAEKLREAGVPLMRVAVIMLVPELP